MAAGRPGPASATTLASSAPGVTPTEIKVGSVSTLTGSIAANFSAFAPGMQAYFKMLNAKGGVNGRKLVLAYDLDDVGNPTTFTQLAHTLIQQDHVFAVAASTYWFTPGLFVQTKTPTYGYNVSGNWNGPDNLFAAGGSVQDYAVRTAGRRVHHQEDRLQIGGHRQLRASHRLVLPSLSYRRPGLGGRRHQSELRRPRRPTGR